MNPAPRATKYFKYLRSQCRCTMMVPPKILAAAAVRPRRILVRIGFIGAGIITSQFSVLSSQFSVLSSQFSKLCTGLKFVAWCSAVTDDFSGPCQDECGGG